jgi:ribose/xylose/arabinose/galactoside ABC-type transport system permease subunit
VFGMTIVLMTAGIDLSVGSAVALVACVMSTFDGSPAFWLTAVPLGLALGVGLGLFNGLLIARLDVPPIIATLGTLFLYRGLCDVVMRGQERGPFYDVPGYEWFGGLTGSLCMAGAVLLVGGAWFYGSRWRREVLMIGGNRVAARYAGIPVERRTLQVYTLMGVLVFVAALCHTARNGSVIASSLTGLELQVIVAAVLGGTRVSGGSGSVTGSVIGVFLVAVLNEGLRGAGLHWQRHLPFEIRDLESVLLAALLVLGVWLNTHAQRWRELFKRA